MATEVKDEDPDARPEKTRKEERNAHHHHPPTLEEITTTTKTTTTKADTIAVHRKARWGTRTLHRKRSSYNLRDEFRSGEQLAANKAATYSPGTHPHLQWEEGLQKTVNTPSYPKTNPPDGMVLKRKRRHSSVTPFVF
jgi:hypothetical protein